MKKYVKKFFVFLTALGSFGAFAEGEQANIDLQPVTDALTTWINTIKTGFTTWTPLYVGLYGVGLTVLLIVVVWKLFKRTTKQAT